MRIRWFTSLFLLASTLSAEAPRFVSPDGRFETYTTPNSPKGYGSKMFLHRAGGHATGRLLWENGRWIDAKWSPDSRFLAVIDHPDGHVTDVYIFGVSAADATAAPSAMLLYHTPAPFTYDVKWELLAWHLKTREVVLKQEVRDQNAGTFVTHTVTATIGTKPLMWRSKR